MAGVVLALIGAAMSSSSSAGAAYYYYTNTIDGTYETDLPPPDKEGMPVLKKMRIEIYEGTMAIIYYDEKNTIFSGTECDKYTQNGNTITYKYPKPSQGPQPPDLVLTIKDKNTLSISNPRLDLKRVLNNDKVGWCNKKN